MENNDRKSKMDEHCWDDNTYTKSKQLNKGKDKKSHVLSDSDIEDILSESEFGQ